MKKRLKHVLQEGLSTAKVEGKKFFKEMKTIVKKSGVDEKLARQKIDEVVAQFNKEKVIAKKELKRHAKSGMKKAKPLIKQSAHLVEALVKEVATESIEELRKARSSLSKTGTVRVDKKSVKKKASKKKAVKKKVVKKKATKKKAVKKKVVKKKAVKRKVVKKKVVKKKATKKKAVKKKTVKKKAVRRKK